MPGGKGGDGGPRLSKRYRNPSTGDWGSYQLDTTAAPCRAGYDGPAVTASDDTVPGMDSASHSVIKVFALLLGVILSLLGAGGSAYRLTPAISPQSVAAASDTSRNWAGYAATGGTYTRIAATWTVPDHEGSTQPGVDAAWVGIGGMGVEDLIQSGTQAVVASDGHAVYEAFYETLPDSSKPLPIAIRGGDSVTVSVSEDRDGVWHIGFTNNTTETSVERTVSYDSSKSSAEWIVEAPSTRTHILPLSDFGSVTFTGARATRGGTDQAIGDLQAKAITLTDGSGTELAYASGIGTDTGSFTVTRQTAQPSVSAPEPGSRRETAAGASGYLRRHFRDFFGDDR